MKCKFCGADLINSNGKCDICGNYQQEQTNIESNNMTINNKKKSKKLILIILLSIFIIIAFII